MSAQKEMPTLAGAGTHELQPTDQSELAANCAQKIGNPQAPDLGALVRFTTFTDVGAKSKREQALPWNDFAEQVRSARSYARKEACPLIAFAVFGDEPNPETGSGSLKHGGNVRQYTGVIGDYDDGQVSIEDAASRARAAGIRALFYTSGRHSPDRPRWRVLAPLANPCSHAGMVRAAGVLNGALGGILAKESVAHGQGFFVGRVQGVQYETHCVNEGNWLDDGPDLFINGVPVAEAPAARQQPTDDNEVVLLALGGLPKPPVEIIASAAAAIPNDGAHPQALLDWFEWRNILWAIKDGAGEAGRDAAEALSLRHPNCTQREFEHQWGRRQSRTDGVKIGVGTLLQRARECGWVDPRHAATRDEQRRQRQKAENERLQDADISAMPTIMSVEAMDAACVWIAEGSQVGLLDDPRQVLSFTDFAGLTAASATEIEDKSKSTASKAREIPNAQLWKKSAVRKTVATRTFHAGAARICRDPDGKSAVNSWRAIDRWAPVAAVDLFLEQVAYLFPEATERGVFLDWLAHIEQRPGELPHYGWLHIASNTGTGRNWLASLLARLWRGQVAPNVDLPALMDSQFNGQLAGRIIAIVDEVQEGAGENPHRNANRLKSIINAEFREINPKFGRQYREHNSCRWLVFSNHLNALPLNDTDRRFRVACHSAPPRTAADYSTLYAALSDVEFINAVGAYLGARDIGGFNPGERPPMSEDKRAAVSASKSTVMKYAETLVADWHADVVTNHDAARALSDVTGGTALFTNAMRRALEDLGCESIDKPLKINGTTQRGWILRNADKWRALEPREIAAEARRPRPAMDDAEGAVDPFAD